MTSITIYTTSLYSIYSMTNTASIVYLILLFVL